MPTPIEMSAELQLELAPLGRPGHHQDPNDLSQAFRDLKSMLMRQRSLDLLGLVAEKVSQADRESLRRWIWEQQTSSGKHGSGFRPSPFMTPRREGHDEEYSDYDMPHMIMSYTGLLSLSILRDDFTQLNRPGLLRFLKACQREDGSFSIMPGSNESDLRTLYCAFAISHMLDDWSAVNVDNAVSFLGSCRTQEGGYGQAPHCEAHGGTTYTAIAALYLVPNRSSAPLTPEERDITIRWLLQNQDTSGGFRGRTGKEPDACYCFWCGVALHILDAHHLVDSSSLGLYLSKCQFKFGGIGKAPGEHPDPYHTYLSLAALSVYPQPEASYSLQSLDPLINGTTETANWAREYIPRPPHPT